MTKKHIKIAEFVIAAIFALALLYFIGGIAVDKKTGPLKAQERFDAFIYQIRNLAATYEPTSEAFKHQFEELVDSSNYEQLQLFINNTLLYDYTAETNTETPPVTATFSDETKTVLGNTLVVSARMYAFTPQQMYSHARIAFFIILLGTLAAVGLLLYLQFFYHTITVQPSISKERFDDIDIHDENVMQEETQKEAVASKDTENTADFEEFEDDFDPIGEMEEENRHSAEEVPLEEPPHEEVTAVEESVEQNFSSHSPVTDTVPEMEEEKETLKSAQTEYDAVTIALENELADAIANEQDISVLIIQLSDLPENSVSATQLKKLLTERLGKQGIVGTHNGNTALIVKNTGLDTALAFAQSLHNAISIILQRSNEQTDTAIGISARAFRMINAERLLTEAEQAALHADAENPIIAFRVNPEKYKQYVQETL